jgi:hypothetical protein
MDFVAVPAGTLPAAALALRGADPSVSFATADSFNTTLGIHGATLCVIPGAAGQVEAARRRLTLTWPANSWAPCSRATLPCLTPPQSSPSLTQRRCGWPGFGFLLMVWTMLIAVSLMSKRFRLERDSILPGLDYATLAAGYLVTAADILLNGHLVPDRGAGWRDGWRGHVVDPLHHHPIVCYAGARPAWSLQPGAAG